MLSTTIRLSVGGKILLDNLCTEVPVDSEDIHTDKRRDQGRKHRHGHFYTREIRLPSKVEERLSTRINIFIAPLPHRGEQIQQCLSQGEGGDGIGQAQ
jgi:hypothetical protein